MVNSKKMSKSTIAVILLSLLLCLSLVLTATGAWFTDKEAGTPDGINFGIVDITVAEGGSFGLVTGDERVDTEAMPGDKIDYHLTVSLAGESHPVYYIYKITVTVNGEVVSESDWSTAALLESDSATIGGEYELSTSLDNTYQGAAITFAYEVRAMQSANVENADAAQTVLEGLTQADRTGDAE